MYRTKQRESLESSYKEDKDVSRNVMNLTFSENLMKHGYRETVDKGKWVSRNDFRAIIGVASTGKGFSPKDNTYVMRDPSEPPVLFRFRQRSPEKWLGSDFKKC
jgi:hypothetical protein